MILSKRERYAGIIAAAVLGIAAMDYYALEPLIERRKEVKQQFVAKQGELNQAAQLRRNRPVLMAEWKKMTDTGLTTDYSAAESKVQHAVLDWAASSNMNLSSLKPERTEQDKQFQKIVFRATGTGSMLSISRFIYRIQTAAIPLRITDMQISARKDGQDDLSLQVGVSTIFLSPETEKEKDKQPRTASRE